MIPYTYPTSHTLAWTVAALVLCACVAWYAARMEIDEDEP